MLNITSFETVKKIAEKSQRVVIKAEMMGDLVTPTAAFMRLSEGLEEGVMLDSPERKSADERYAYIGLDPMATLSRTPSEISFNTLDELRKFYQEYRAQSEEDTKLAGGILGYIAYDSVRMFEAVPDRNVNQAIIPDVLFKSYQTGIVFDKTASTILITRIIQVDDHLEAGYEAAKKIIEAVRTKMLKPVPSEFETRVSVKNNTVNESVVDIEDEAFVEMIEKAKEYIAKGDAFQIVTSRTFKKNFKGNDFSIYRALRALNPSPYHFYLRYPNFTIVGASPEKLVSLRDGLLEVTPIAGTRPRGRHFEEDYELEKNLLSDEKELAEHMMLVDLGRNDLGSIAKASTIRVKKLKEIKRFSSVMHMSSSIQAEIRDDRDCFDSLKAAFPAGTLSGAPKIRAMEIIDEIESSRRGIYGGGVVVIDNQGNMNSCIAIRTALVKDGVVTVRAGAGVVMDSNPQSEADETRHKSKGILNAIAFAEENFA